MKINGKYYTVCYYFGEYRVGLTKTYQLTIWSADEESARAEVIFNYKGAKIKWVN